MTERLVRILSRKHRKLLLLVSSCQASVALPSNGIKRANWSYGPLAYGPLAYGPLAYGPLAYGPLAYGPLAYGPVDKDFKRPGLAGSPQPARPGQQARGPAASVE